MYSRGPSSEFGLIDECDLGFGWLAHPDEEGMRASQSFRFDEEVWLVDPLDAPGIDDHIDELGEVVGVTVCSSMHTRDAEVFARRYDVPVYLPEGMSRVPDLIDAEIRWYEEEFPARDVTVIRRNPFPAYDEANLYHEPTRTLYIADAIGTTPWHTVGDETIGAQAILRLFPPNELLTITPERICFGHGVGVFTDAGDALEETVTAGQRRFPRAVVSNIVPTLRATVASLRG